MANTKKWVEHDDVLAGPVDFDAVHGQLHGKSGRVGTFLLSINDSLVRDKPVVPTASQIPALRVRPPVDVGLVRIRDTEREAMQRRIAVLRQVENVLMAIVDEAIGMKRLVMPD